VRIRVARHGREKLRPVVVVSPNEVMDEGTPLVGVAITGTLDPPTGFDVPLPWQAQGRSRTGLDRPNAAVCCWFVTFTATDVIDAIGHVPPEPMRRIDEAIRRFRGDSNQIGRFPAASQPRDARGLASPKRGSDTTFDTAFSAPRKFVGGWP
jgi:mRNA-degrading endonuclease toxin of MazEF toxin-antitoxin module